MADSYDLSKLGPDAFENIVNFLALKTLGLGSTGFGPGPDGGRDGFFEGDAPYPSETNRWNGVWYIQSKFHKPHLSTNQQKWLIDQVTKEIKAFEEDHSDRIWPDNWIIATNIDQSGKPETGSFDVIKKILNKSPGGKKINFHIWGGRKILDLLSLHGDVARHYGHFLTPGHLISALYAEIADKHASIEEIVRYFVVTQFNDHMFTKLDQAGSSSDVRPAVHDLFIDLPFCTSTGPQSSEILAELCSASAQCHRYSLRKEFPESWHAWNKRSKRARVTLIKGGPGQGKSTVGQYLCQIHRACLILAEDGLKVIDATNTAAKSVFEAAQRDEFWPASPRIPIQIELKEFAHWYSQRTTAQTRNILVYLAETVAKKIGTEVLAKTIKNALSKRFWIVVFDGLDEVPNDYKDEVANEVMYFLNDVLIEIDGDVLALCTSRPQGYSGQFAGLDGPVLDLMQLDADAAIRCARPLLKFGRNIEEAEKSIQILEAAIQSPNVKELMTTPLQSHIMAVVVRDGGRPPERRWQLFNSFYLVMKKRESLKNFQNPRIAKLLREEDRLLKSVHMRLGFVLHARAERSAGAQTTLSKEEFRHLVHDVVTELVDHEIEETVADVMEATTERLVLVSTPENGEQVRFDIRQLQEFFAAEFLYAGVSPDELANRIETIGGDAHWREVMHFLMSALIENQRTTDLAVAVQVLRRLNEGDETGINSLYFRRMARAGLLASRLLIEGVLEQDQRDRQQIKPLFDPLSGIFDFDILRTLVRANPTTRSRQWLIQLLLDKIVTASAREYVGALFLLGWLLPNDHVGSMQASGAFINAPIGFQEVLFKLWAPVTKIYHLPPPVRTQMEETLLSQWVIGLAIDILNSSNWAHYSQFSIENLLKICRSNKERFVEICEMKGLDGKAADTIFRCLSTPNPVELRSESSVDCGLVTAIPYLASWSNRKMPSHLKGVDAKAHISKTDGAFRLMLTCVWFAKDRSEAALKEFVKSVDVAGAKRTTALPGFLLALVPIAGAYTAKPYDIEHLRDIGTNTGSRLVLPTLKNKIQPQYAELTIQEVKETTAEQWRLLATYLPTIAINLAFNIDDYSLKGGTKFVPQLTSLIQSMPSKAVPHILKWGYLQEHQPELFNELKVNVCALPPEKCGFWINSHARLIPFKLQLPEDIPLLSILAPALLQWSDESPRFFGKTEELSLSTMLSSYGLSAEDLRNIAESNTHNQTVRAGALALYWMLIPPDGIHKKLNLLQEKNFYVELVNEVNENWLTLALIRGVLTSFSESDASALSVVTYLMECCIDGNGPHNELIELIGNWRERSTAPVQSKQVLDKWLGYNFQAPLYK